MTCPVVAVGGVNGNGIIDATVAILRKRTFVVAHLEPGLIGFSVTTADGTRLSGGRIPTGSATGSTVAVLFVPEGQKAIELHALDAEGLDMGAVDISHVADAPKPTPLMAEDAAKSASISARPGG